MKDRDPSKLVRIDTLRRGQRFECISGLRWTYERRDGAYSGVHHVVGDDGSQTVFAACAEVTLV